MGPGDGSRVSVLFRASSACSAYSRTVHVDSPSSKLRSFIQTGQVPNEELDKQIDHVNKTRCDTFRPFTFFFKGLFTSDYNR